MIALWSPEILTWSIRTVDLWKLENKTAIKIITDVGTYLYTLSPGYSTDFRSGPSIINPVIPKIGNIKLALCWLIHDVNYHGFLSRQQSDTLLYQMLLWAGMSKFKASCVYGSVRIFGGSHYNHLDDDQGFIYNVNRDFYVKFEWRDK